MTNLLIQNLLIQLSIYIETSLFGVLSIPGIRYAFFQCHYKVPDLLTFVLLELK